MYQGRPVGTATVVLHAIKPRPSTGPKVRPLSSIGFTDEKGIFQISTFGKQDGAPAGEYIVTIELQAERMVGEELVRDGPHLLPLTYSNPKSSPLRCTVDAGNNVLPTFELSQQQ